MSTERPILFSGPMVRAILDGRKTQTRRVVKQQRGHTLPWVSMDPASDTDPNCIAYHGVRPPPEPWPMENTEDGMCPVVCPHGKPGDRLWVRETWATTRGLDHVKPSNLMPGFPGEFKAGGTTFSHVEKLCDRGKWRPSIFLPRHASRITLEITAVRVERLQEITEEDAKAEGCDFVVSKEYGIVQERPICEFRVLWDSINADKHPWTSNPWVWVISFQRL